MKTHHPLKTGTSVVVESKTKQELAASVADFSAEEIHLAMAASEFVFRQDEEVRIKYWEEGVVYCWNARIMSLPGDRKMVISLLDRGLTVQRRKFPRYSLAIPISFLVTDASKTWLIGKSQECRTRDLSLGGVCFESTFPLEVGDKLALKLQPPRLQKLSASGWVVRSEPVLEGGKPFRLLALEFLQLEESEQKLLLQFLATHEE